MKSIKNLKSILIIIVFVLSMIFLALVIFKVRSNNSDIEENNKFQKITIGSAMAQVYSSVKYPSFKEGDKIFGDKDAKLKIFVYEDAANLYSAELAETIDRIYSENKNDVSVIIRPYISKNETASREAALAIECAGDQNKWIEMRALLLAKTKNEGLNLEELNSYASQINLDQSSLNACLTNNEKSAKIEGLSSEAETYSVLGAPTIFIGKEMILGARPYEDYTDSNGDKILGLKTIVTELLKK
ncbi:MAG: DsbA family protein [Patescibacteria group bacterium]